MLKALKMILTISQIHTNIYSGIYQTHPKTKDAVQFPPDKSSENLMVVICNQSNLEKIRNQRKFDFTKNIKFYGPCGERVQIYNDKSRTSGTKQVSSKYNKLFQLDEESDFLKDLKNLQDKSEIIFLLSEPAYYKENLNSVNLNRLLRSDLDTFKSYKFSSKITFFTDTSFWNKFSDTFKFPDYSNIRNIVYDETLKLLYQHSNFNSLGKLMNYIFGKELGGETIPQYVSLKFKKEDDVEIIHPRNGEAKIYSKSSDLDYDELRIKCIADGKEHQFILFSLTEPINVKCETKFLEDFESQIIKHEKHKNLRKKFDEAEDKKDFMKQITLFDYHIEFNRFEMCGDPTKDLIIKYFESFFTKLGFDYQKILSNNILRPPKIGYNNFMYPEKSVQLNRQTSCGTLNIDSFN